MRFDHRFTAICVAVAVAFLTEAHTRSQAAESVLLAIGPRIGFSTTSTPLIGKQQKEDMRLYDVAAFFRLPWYSLLGHGNWKLGTRLITSLGVIEGAGGAGLLATFVPDLALSGWDGLVSLDAGAGVGLLSRTKFGLQDFGGPAQIVVTVGIMFAPFTHGYAGFRVQHLSDAGFYGSDALGVDMYLLEAGYKF
jgi:Lipid A 3-O-deacylase (PagL)